jgi:4-oxalocrotonate tautomerase
MPILQVKVSTYPSAELSKAIATTLVDITAQVLHKQPSVTAVAIDFIPPEHWHVGGATLAEQQQSSFFLDIKVVEGTNTKDEKARYVAEVFAAMRDLLGALHNESYVYIHEVRADAYGFGGVTQEYRYVSNKLDRARGTP